MEIAPISIHYAKVKSYESGKPAASTLKKNVFHFKRKCWSNEEKIPTGIENVIRNWVKCGEMMYNESFNDDFKYFDGRIHNMVFINMLWNKTSSNGFNTAKKANSFSCSPKSGGMKPNRWNNFLITWNFPIAWQIDFACTFKHSPMQQQPSLLPSTHLEAFVHFHELNYPIGFFLNVSLINIWNF